MASSVIHMCVAKKINEKLNLPLNMILLGSIAPDISKHVGETKTRSHFLTDGKTEDIERFLEKYKNQLSHPFMMGYFIHLYTDFLWNKYFISEIVENNTITLLNGDKIPANHELYKKLIYNDYTNLNIQLLDEYNLDLSLFYEEAVLPDLTMEEIPVERLSLLIDYTGVIIENTKKSKEYTFNLEQIRSFIETSSNLIYLKIKELESEQ